VEATFTPIMFGRDDTFYFATVQPGLNVYLAEVDFDPPAFRGQPRLISHRFDGRNHTPSWSRDGSKVAYVSNRPAEGLILVIQDSTTGEEQDLRVPRARLKLHRWALPSWMPDGTQIIVRAPARIVITRQSTCGQKSACWEASVPLKAELEGSVQRGQVKHTEILSVAPKRNRYSGIQSAREKSPRNRRQARTNGFKGF
jgi:hypothetical protein